MMDTLKFLESFANNPKQDWTWLSGSGGGGLIRISQMLVYKHTQTHTNTHTRAHIFCKAAWASVPDWLAFSDRSSVHCFGGFRHFQSPILSVLRRCQWGAVSRRCGGIAQGKFRSTLAVLPRSSASRLPAEDRGPALVCWPGALPVKWRGAQRDERKKKQEKETKQKNNSSRCRDRERCGGAMEMKTKDARKRSARKMSSLTASLRNVWQLRRNRTR